MEESIRIRRAAEPLELVKLVRSIWVHVFPFDWNIGYCFLNGFPETRCYGQKVKELKEELTRGEVVVELSWPLKEKITDEILVRLKSLNGSEDTTEQRGQWTLIAM